MVYDSPVVLPLAGTYISCIIPKLLNYEHLDTKYESDGDSPLHSHFIVEGDDDAIDVPDFNDIDDDADEDEDNEETVLVRGGNFVVSKRQHPPSPSFGDLLLSKRTHQSTPFEVCLNSIYICSYHASNAFTFSFTYFSQNIGLYSSFVGLEESLWLLWQLAITGESFLILSPHARTCSQAALAFTRLVGHPASSHLGSFCLFTKYERRQFDCPASVSRRLPTIFHSLRI
ncbi:unnamed protein product [Phytophthora lilii]|uniref:Unnamed protein product n=1 Tax=Phytophthora lilii TaxID=2077276 RepID=A0A9W6TH08_9STRA|nr:unnamed protein product [Phytophthora lilii]